MSFEKNVFINCPFDDDYKPLLRALIFTVLYVKLEPQISITKSSSHVRVNEIIKLIRSSKYSIHDISRCEPLNGVLPRFNMPYEMGLDIGCSTYGNGKLKKKECLILEKEKDRYDAVLSDISGQDIKHHDNDPEQMIAKVRDWFCAALSTDIPPTSKILTTYNDYLVRINATLIANDFTQNEIDNLSIAEYIKAVKLELRRPIIGSIKITVP